MQHLSCFCALSWVSSFRTSIIFIWHSSWFWSNRFAAWKLCELWSLGLTKDYVSNVAYNEAKVPSVVLVTATKNILTSSSCLDHTVNILHLALHPVKYVYANDHKFLIEVFTLCVNSQYLQVKNRLIFPQWKWTDVSFSCKMMVLWVVLSKAGV